MFISFYIPASWYKGYHLQLQPRRVIISPICFLWSWLRVEEYKNGEIQLQMSSFPIFAHLGPAVRYRISRRGSSGVWIQLHGNLVALSDTRRCPVTIQRPCPWWVRCRTGCMSPRSAVWWYCTSLVSYNVTKHGKHSTGTPPAWTRPELGTVSRSQHLCRQRWIEDI